ncbi:MAG: LPS-assembly protein LptD [Nitrospiraceae bacterium]|nr:MAG: LPS-assembly protein LptD [Nitrospiraceae bacterium]
MRSGRRHGRNMFARQNAKVCVILFLLFSSFFSSLTSSFAEGEADISADRLEHLSQTNTYIAKGDVRIVFEGATLRADEITLNNATGDAVATGNVAYEDTEAVIRADKIEMNVRTKLGVLRNGDIFYKRQNAFIHGENIKKVGDTTFSIDKAAFTTCDAEIPAWHISGKDITVTQHDSLSAWHTKFYIKNTPVLYTPYFFAPLIRQRQTGFLFPSFGYSSTRGRYYKQGFFWAIEDNQDASVYLDYYSEKGLAEGLDYRYILGPETNGEFWAYHVRDNNPDRDLYEFKTYHNQKLPHDISGYLKLHAVSESDYYETLDSTSFGRFGLSSWESSPFGFASEERLQKYLESDLHISKPFDAGRTYFLAQARQSLEGKSNEIPQSLPEAGFIVNTMSGGPFSFNASFTGVNFWRKDGQKGQRYDINPNLYLSFGRAVNITQKIGLRDTAYFLDNPTVSQNRFLYDLSTTFTTRLLKTYPAFVHLIEPSVEYEYIPSSDDEDIPFFDSIDTIPKTSSINYSFTNRLSGSTSLNLESRFRLSQSYSLLDVDENFSPVLAEAVLSSDNADLHLNSSYNVYDGQLTETVASLTFRGPKGYLTLGENYRRASELDQMTFEAGLNKPVTLYNKPLPVDLMARLWYDLNGNGIQELTFKTTYTRQCWALAVSYNRKPDEYQIIFAVELKGLGTVQLGSL